MSQFDRESPISKYTSPIHPAAALDSSKQSEAETIRHQMLKHEASVQSIGTLYLIGAVFLTMGGILLGLSIGGDVMPELAVGVGFVFLVGALNLYVGIGLRKLDPKVKRVAIVFAVFGLIGFPLGTLISAWSLHLLCSDKGAYVFSEGYANVRKATPHVKYKSSLIVWFFVCLLVLVMFLAIASLFLG